MIKETKKKAILAESYRAAAAAGEKSNGNVEKSKNNQHLSNM